jgi:CRP-like cAMP-binding protein
VPDNCSDSEITLEDMLRRTSWAAKLSSAEFVRACDGSLERAVEAGGFVCRKGEPVDHWFGVITGLAKMSSDWATGKTASFTGIAAGGWFGEGSMLKAEPRRYDVVALRNTRVACMKRETFLWLLDHSIPFNRFVINQINERLGLFIGLLESERLADIDARVARAIGSLFHPVLQPGIDSCIAISQEEIGYLAGVSRQRVNRSMQALEKAGFLIAKYGAVTVLDLDGLRRFGG